VEGENHHLHLNYVKKTKYPTENYDDNNKTKIENTI